MDEKTLKKALKGDRNGFEQVYREYFDGLWRYVFSRIRNREIASDIVSDSFIALFENIKNIKYPKALKSYLYKIAKNRMIKFYSEEKPRSITDFELDRLTFDKSEVEKESNHEHQNTGSKIKLEEVLKNLPENYSEVLRLRFLSGLKVKEVAEILEESEGNVKVLQNRAIKRSKEIIFSLYNLKC